MAKSANQRAKLLYLEKIFTEKSDEEHKLSRNDIITMLSQYGVEVERKTLYSDIETLRDAGLDIIKDDSSPRDVRYYLAGREFELAEVQLLANAVACSKFITDRKSHQLIEKISTLVSEYNGSAIRREIIVSDRIKAQNEHIYYNVDKIQEAIARGVKIKFKYFNYTVDKEKNYHSDKNDLTLSPYCLTWKDENYYCVGYYEKYTSITNFRVDKMERVTLTDEKIMKTPDFSAAEHSRKLFGMYGGKEERVTIRFDNSLAGVVLDRFGMDVLLIKDSEKTFTLCENVVVSPIFFGWLTQFSDKVEVLKPETVCNEFKQTLKKALENY